MKLPESRSLQTNQVETVNEWIEMDYQPFHFFPERDMPQSFSPTNLIPRHSLKKGDLIMADLERKEAESRKLDQEIIEKQQTLMNLQQAIQSATSEFQATSASHLAAGLAHEIRNPLTTIKGFIQLLKPELQAVGKLEFADVALDEIQRANSLLTEFLSIMKPGSSEKKKLSINKLAASMIKLFSSESILKGIEIYSELPDEELFVLADENAIKQVLVNLLKNAIEAVEGETGAAISLVVGKVEDFIMISVIDNGRGIDEFSLKKIFTPFYTTKADGTGIGLAISKQIIESHGGHMSVTTQPLKTVFKFALPAV